MISDEEIVYDALRRYTVQRQTFAVAIAKPDFKLANGEAPTSDDISLAIATAQQCERLEAYAKEKVESPIILVQ